MEILKSFLNKNKIEYETNFDLSVLSSIKIGGKANIVVFPSSTKQLQKVLMFCFAKKIYYKILGGASNLLFVGDISYPVISTTRISDEIELEKNLVKASAGVSLSKFCEFLKKNCLSGFEGLIAIPATIGGAIFNNAGAFGYSISDKLVKISVFSKGKIFDIYKNQIKFGYHYSNLSGFIILSATFLFENKNEYDIINLCNKFTYLRNKSQPSGLSLGSVYSKTNGKSAGFYIERAGLKGTRFGGVVVSSKHSNFFVNDKVGSAVDFLMLMSYVERVVEKQFGVTLISEIEKVRDNNEIVSRLSCTF